MDANHATACGFADVRNAAQTAKEQPNAEAVG